MLLICRMLKNSCGFIPALAMLIAGCGGHLYVKSTPEAATINLVSLQNQSSSVMGQTPLMISKEDLATKQLQGPYLIRVTKDGYMPKEVIVSTLSGIEAEMNFDMQTIQLSGEVNRLIGDLFEAQNLAQKGDRRGALEKLEELEKKHPGIAAVHEMTGSIYMLEGNYSMASSEFSNALGLDPNNIELKALAQNAGLRAKGDRVPASTGKAGK